jgi:hypothetical protein
MKIKEIKLTNEQIRLYNKYICNYCNTNKDNLNIKCTGHIKDCPRYDEYKCLKGEINENI